MNKAYNIVNVVSHFTSFSIEEKKSKSQKNLFLGNFNCKRLKTSKAKLNNEISFAFGMTSLSEFVVYLLKNSRNKFGIFCKAKRGLLKN